LVRDIPAGDGKIVNLFLQCNTKTGKKEREEEKDMKSRAYIHSTYIWRRKS
jgi:hypothetical protein